MTTLQSPAPSRLEMRNISIAFAGFRALDQVDFTLEGGSVHALIGANGAGKSTLMAILSGTHAHYQGEILIDGEPAAIRSPYQSKRQGIHLVQQEVDVALVPTLTVGENIMLDRLAERGQLCHWPRLYRQAQGLLAQLRIDIDVRRPVGDCTLAEKQHILLARALSHRCRFLILDEPTAPLDREESERLFAVTRRLQAQGIGVVFISHRIHELAQICDRLTVLRDGKQVGDGPMDGLSGGQIVEKMLGHSLESIFPPPRPAGNGDILLRVEGLHDDTLLRDISLTLRKGEIVGVAGLAGAGKTELCKALFGASSARVAHGELKGKPWRPTTPYDAVRRGLALVPEERRKEGIFIHEPIPMNLSVAADNTFSRWGWFSAGRARRFAQQVVDRLGIRASGLDQKLLRLSGGNQQKVAIGKWLRGHAEVLIFDEPTKGVDIKAKQDLFVLIDDLARQGKGIIYASGEFSELLGLCDRICIMWDGRIVAQVDAHAANEETLLLYSTGGTLP
ncbi:sugar ABC transporter ATP-binding protein [Acerihabitans arboris]|uniref:ATP-binding cassette domain-containing protein n=1 Tax=Acerihabitans arboris TaxID=2691583 RepID=A0A845SJS3_9GAMM|nr:sugar ABC transporter ATP-binding protein [Acerihabitans arboris]NDL63632.1 ATP-binding cassette domain-containing protein [Acerihabitans arboris]